METFLFVSFQSFDWMLIKVDNIKDTFFIDIDPLLRNQAVREIIKEVVVRRQQILTLYKSNPEQYQDLLNKTVSLALTQQKKSCNLRNLNEITKKLELPTVNLSNFQVLMFGKPLEDNKRISEKIGNPKTTVLRVTFPDEVTEQLILNDYQEPVQITEKPEPPTKKQKFEREREEEFLKEEDLSHIPKSRILKEKLLDTKFQLLILEIDQAKDREKALAEVLKKEPDFSIFLSEMLYIVGERSLEDLQRDLEHLGNKKH